MIGRAAPAAVLLLALLLVLLAGAGAVAHAAGACPERWEAAAGPLLAGTGPADFGAVPEACPATELALRARATLLVASTAPDFYGSAIATATLRARYALGPRTWFSIAFDAVTYRFVANAVVQSGGTATGPPTIAIHRALVMGRALTLALYGRALLPLDSARAEGVELGAELGAAVSARLHPRAGLQGGLSVAAPVDVISGEAHGHLRPAGLAEAFYAPRPFVALSAGASARTQLAPDAALTSVSLRVGARFALRHGIWLAVLAEGPVAGTDRTDAIAGLYGGFRY